jgi:hypothetical protein
MTFLAHVAVPNTISDEHYAQLQRRAIKANPDSFSRKAIQRRHLFAAQCAKAHLS